MTDRAEGITARTSARRSAVRVQVVHLAGVPAIQPLFEESELREAVGGGDAAQIESDRRRLCLHVLGSHRDGRLDRAHDFIIAGPPPGMRAGVSGTRTRPHTMVTAALVATIAADQCVSSP